MKKIILSAIVALSALAADAQVWAGGSIGFGIIDYDNAEKSEVSYELMPEVGYSLNEKWDVAVALGIRSISNVDGTTQDQTIYKINPYARYTFATSGIASFFVEGGFFFSSTKKSGSDAVTGFTIGVRPGVKFDVTENISLVSRIGFLGYGSQKDSYNQFSFGIDDTKLSLGMYYSF